MKVIAFNRRAGMPIVMPPQVDIIVDSATVAAGRPLFLPDFAPAWEARICPAFRIGRLGKGISAKFAMRYYDAVTVAMRLVPLWDDGMTGGIDGLFDNCLAFGDWRPLDGGGVESLRIDAGELSEDFSPGSLLVEDALAAVTRYATVKTGDVVMPCSLPGALAVKVGDDVAATLDGSPCLSVRIR